MGYKIPMLSNLNQKLKTVFNDLNGGVNNGLPPIDLKDNSATEIKNMNSYAAPALAPRKKRYNYTYGFSGTMSSLFKHKDSIMCLVEGNKWKKIINDIVSDVATLSSSADASVVDFLDKTILVNGADKKAWDGNTTVENITDMPASHFIALHANRLYVANKKNQTLTFSALRKYDDWKTAEDSGVIEIETSDGTGCTGLVSYANHIMYFKKNSMHELYGTGPLNYVMKTLTDDIGCVSNRSIQEVQGRLYFLSQDGIRVYSGGTVPNNTISFPIQEYIDQLDPNKFNRCVAGTDQERYFINLQLKYNKNVLCVFDTRFNVWYVEDDIKFTDFVYFKNNLFGLNDGSFIVGDPNNGTAAKSIVNMSEDEGNETFDWHWISKTFQDGTPSGKKTYYKFFITAKMDTGSSFDVSISTNFSGNTFTKVATIVPKTPANMERILIPVNVANNVDWIRIKLSGTGYVEFYNIERQMRIMPNVY